MATGLHGVEIGQQYLTVDSVFNLREAKLEEYIKAEEKWWQDFARDALRHYTPLRPEPDWRYVGEALVHPEPVAARDLDITGFDFYAHNCNRRCGFCLTPLGLLESKDILDFNLVQDVVRWATEPDSKITEITLLGGEFALQPEAARIIKYIGDTPASSGELMQVRAVTNGSPAFQRLLDDPEIVEIFRHSRVAVSREAFSSELNDAVRGRFATTHFDATVAKLVDLGIHTDMNVTVMKSTVHELPSLIRMAQASGIKRVNIHGFSPVGNGYEQPQEMLSAEDWDRQVLSVAAELTETIPHEFDFTIDCEVLYAPPVGPIDYNDQPDSSYCAVQENGNLQFIQPIIPGTAMPANVCAYYTGTPNLSKFVFWNGQLFKRAGHSEVTDTADCSQGCPVMQNLYSNRTPVCLYHHGRLPRSSLRFADLSYPQPRTLV